MSEGAGTGEINYLDMLPSSEVPWGGISSKLFVKKASGKVYQLAGNKLDNGQTDLADLTEYRKDPNKNLFSWEEYSFNDEPESAELPEVVIIGCHGFNGRSEPYARMFKMLGGYRGKAKMRMVAIREPGHGETSAKLDYNNVLNQICEIPSVQKAKHIILHGSSMGGAIAIGLAMDERVADRTRRLMVDGPMQEPIKRIRDAIKIGLLVAIDSVIPGVEGRQKRAQIEERFPIKGMPFLFGTLRLLEGLEVAENFFKTIPEFDGLIEEFVARKSEQGQKRGMDVSWVFGTNDGITKNGEYDRRMRALTMALGGDINDYKTELPEEVHAWGLRDEPKWYEWFYARTAASLDSVIKGSNEITDKILTDRE